MRKKLYKELVSVGEEILVVETTNTGEVFEWNGVITEITDYCIETEHSRNPITHPQWRKYDRAYEKIWTKHYGIDNIKKLNNATNNRNFRME